MKKFNVILATDLLGGIGANGKLPWKFRSDINLFKTLTIQNTTFPGINNVLIMGRKTWESLGMKPLFSRRCYVISTTLNSPDKDNVKYFTDFNSALSEASKLASSDIWVIGGVRVYETALNHWCCNKVYLTQIHETFNTDTKLDLLKYKIEWINTITNTDINELDNKEYNISFKVGVVNKGIETQYLETLHNVTITGERRETRNAITLSKFSKTLSWDLNDGFPLLTTKKMFWKGIVEELLFFIRGDTDSTKLLNKGIKIWEPNTNKGFLDKLKLNYQEGEMGPMYGYQWRFFNKPYPVTEENKHISGIDQLKRVIEEIKNDPHSRRILMTDFNPEQVHLGVLYPCHSIVIQFYVENKKLSCTMYQRSGDLFLGIPFNIASTSLLLHIVAKLTNLNPGMVHLIIGDYHIYESHLPSVYEQITRTPYQLPTLTLPEFNTLEDVEKLSFSDFIINNYIHYPTIRADMVA